MMWTVFLLGLLAGWLIEWIIDWLYWRRTTDRDLPVVDGPVPMQMSMPAPMPAQVAAAEGGPAVSADTPAGEVAGEVAMGAPGAVSTSSATLTTRAPVYRQEDLEAIAGVGPRVGAMLRNNGITTFTALAATPAAELVRLVESAGEQAERVGVESWPAQARLAAAHDWAGFAAFKHDLPPAGNPVEA